MEGVIKTTLPRQCGEVVELSGLQFSGNPAVFYITKSALNSQNNFCRNELNKLASFRNFLISMEFLTNILYISFIIEHIDIVSYFNSKCTVCKFLKFNKNKHK